MKKNNMNLIGWIFFLLSAVFFIITSTDLLELAAAVTFALGCVVFLISMFSQHG